MQSGSPIFLYSGSLETQYWRGFARVGCAKLKMFALLDCSELPLRPEPALAVDNPAAHPRWTAALRAVPGLPTAAATGTDALRWTKPAACPRSGCLAFEKLNPGRGEGLGVQRGQPQAVVHPGHRAHPCPEPSGWVTEAAGARCAKARQGAQPWGSGGASPLPGSALGAAGTAQAKRAGGHGRPLGAIYAGRRGAAPRTRDL